MNEQYLKDLAKFRKLVEDMKGVLTEAETYLSKTPEYQRVDGIRISLKEYKEKAEEITKAIKSAAIEETKATYDPETKSFAKPSLKGLGLRTEHNITVKYDKTAAEAWIKENAKLLLKVDWTAFEEMAKDKKNDIPGVEIIDEVVPNITIASDLSSYLEEK